LLGLLWVAPVFALEDEPVVEHVKFQVTGLFMPGREADLRAAFEKLPLIKIVDIDYANAEATFAFAPKLAFPTTKREQIVTQFDNQVRQATSGTFGIKPLRTIPREKLQWIQIPVGGCDCKACSLAAYESVFKLEGVEQATASFRAGLVTALIDPTKTDRATLEAALKKRGVEVRTASPNP